ncbi:MAG: hypothetical protein ACYDA3_08555 [Gaiellaceae bacterium]
MANKGKKDLISRLADAGEEAMNRLTDAPGMDRVTQLANSTRDRVDELTKRVRGIDELERRLAKLEQQVAGLAKKPAAKRPPAPKNPG